MRIGDVLKAKASHDVVTIAPDAGVRELIALLAEHNVGALIVSSDGTHRRRASSASATSSATCTTTATVLDNPVAAIMTTDVETCARGHLVDDLMKMMTERRVRHVPVVVDGRLRGIISIGDVVKHRIDQLEFERDQLDSYVHGTGG